MKLTKCLVGNTSAAIREGSFIGVPSVSIGSRQNGRDRGRNVLDSSYDTNEIYKKIKKQLSIKGVLKDNIYGRGNASKKIKKILENINVEYSKTINLRMKYLAIIPARKGSKRIKNKNIKRFNREPLINWTIRSALKSKCFDKILYLQTLLKFKKLPKNSN